MTIIFIKYTVFLGVNLLVPWLVSRYWIKRPISRWISIPLYIVVINTLNIFWAIAWDLSRKPGFLFFIYFVWALSNGYQTKRDKAKAAVAYSRDNEVEATDLMERATKLLAKGRPQEALKEYNHILAHYPTTSAAELAKDYIARYELKE